METIHRQAQGSSVETFSQLSGNAINDENFHKKNSPASSEFEVVRPSAPPLPSDHAQTFTPSATYETGRASLYQEEHIAAIAPPAEAQRTQPSSHRSGKHGTFGQKLINVVRQIGLAPKKHIPQPYDRMVIMLTTKGELQAATTRTPTFLTQKIVSRAELTPEEAQVATLCEHQPGPHEIPDILYFLAQKGRLPKEQSDEIIAKRSRKIPRKVSAPSVP